MQSEIKDDTEIRAMRFDGWNFVPVVLSQRASIKAAGPVASDDKEPRVPGTARIDQSAPS